MMCGAGLASVATSYRRDPAMLGEAELKDHYLKASQL
jgi:hypothetical protein